MSQVQKNIIYIEKLFMHVANFFESHKSFEDVIQYLEKEPVDFRSIVYESAAFEFAWRELKIDSSIENWKRLYKFASSKHKFHLEIGLGWAFAKAEIFPMKFLNEFNADTKFMVYEGIGYYYALFSPRKTMKEKMYPLLVAENYYDAFDQGVGRRLWYLSRGNAQALIKLINSFEDSRKASLWCGIGIAMGYVGGFTELELNQLLVLVNVNRNQLRDGILLAIVSRVKSDSLTIELENFCKNNVGHSAENIVQKYELETELNPQDSSIFKFREKLNSI